jgi:hypothetical protein
MSDQGKRRWRVGAGVFAVFALLSCASVSGGDSDAAAAIDPRRDARLAQRVTLHSDGVPAALVLERLAVETGVRMTAAGPAGDERLIAIVPDAPLAAVMGAIADLYRLEWSRTGGDRPIYRLQKLPSVAREEARLRQRCLDQALGEIARRLDEPYPRSRDMEFAPIREATVALLREWEPLLLRERFLHLPLPALPAPQREDLSLRLQPLLRRHAAYDAVEDRDLLAVIRQGGGPVPDNLLRKEAAGFPVRPAPPEECVVVAELRTKRGLELYAGLRLPDEPDATSSSRVMTLISARDPSTETAGVELYRDRLQAPRSPLDGADLFAGPVCLNGEPAPESWRGNLERLSAITDISVYSDHYPAQQFEDRRYARLKPAPSAAEALDELCRARRAPEGLPQLGDSSFWWRRGDAALVRSAYWLWEAESVIPWLLLDALAHAAGTKTPLRPEHLRQLGELSFPQYRPLLGMPGSAETWRRVVRIPARLSPEARVLAVTEGLTWANLPPADRSLLSQLLGSSTAVLARYHARLQLVHEAPGPRVRVHLDGGAAHDARGYLDLPALAPEALGVSLVEPAPGHATPPREPQP